LKVIKRFDGMCGLTLVSPVNKRRVEDRSEGVKSNQKLEVKGKAKE
jgi:hypothetical protein